MDTFDLVPRARAFAIGAHEAIGQRRKYTGEPYWHHPRAVARMVWTETLDARSTAAAWLHDVLEDTQVTVETIGMLFGAEVAQLVAEVTDVSRPEDGNRAARKALDRAHLASASPEAQTIKVADLIDNTSSIVQHDPGFARIYMAEKRALLTVLAAADLDLLVRAWQVVDDYEQSNPSSC